MKKPRRKYRQARMRRAMLREAKLIMAWNMGMVINRPSMEDPLGQRHYVNGREVTRSINYLLNTGKIFYD